MDTEATNDAIRDGSLGKTIQATLEQVHAESAYFTTFDGQRTAYVVFDLKDNAQVPAIAEPLFLSMKAKIEFSPVMTPEDLDKGLSSLPPMS